MAAHKHLGPRQDAVRTLARAVRLCGQTRIILPSYENLPLMWLRLTAPQEDIGGKMRIPPDSEWEVAGPLLMDHTIIGGAEVTDPAKQRELYEQSSFWAHGLKVGNRCYWRASSSSWPRGSYITRVNTRRRQSRWRPRSRS